MKPLLLLIAITAAILLVCIAAMAISILVKKNGQFPETEISRNKHMRKLGLMCAKQEEILMLKKMGKKKLAEGDCGCCSGCCANEKEA